MKKGAQPHSPAVAKPAPGDLVRLPPPLLQFLDAGLSREWLVTNGLGGYASGTVAGACTRRYHGLLVAALAPPVRRTLLVAKVDETVMAADEAAAADAAVELGTNEYHDGTVAPEGYRRLAGFRLVGTVPVWTFTLPGGTLEKTVWMGHERNTTYVRYRLAPGGRPVRLLIRPYLAERDHHGTTRGDPAWRFALTPVAGGVRVTPWPRAVPYVLRASSGTFTPEPVWHWHVLHRAERERGLDALEDLYVPGRFEVEMDPGGEVTLVASAEPDGGEPIDGAGEYARERARQDALLRAAAALPRDPVPIPEPGGLPARLVLAADQFLVRGAGRRSVIAGYHWFEDWGRDTMIALPGLTLSTGRPAEARDILLSFAEAVDQGMLPNRFPDDGAPPEYTSADAALWYFHALDRYLERTRDRGLLAALFPVLREIVARYRAGTRHGIRVDPADGLLEAEAPGLALTWMDARVDGRVITPRTGKPVDLNALWHHALCLAAGWAESLGQPAAAYAEAAAAARRSFAARFYDPARGYLVDVIGPDGTLDTSLRPNQLLALAFPEPLLDAERARAALEAVSSQLLTPFGLRTLAPGSPGYRGRYEGSPAARDEAYHQGTVWPWWLGVYVAALVRTTGDRVRARGLLEAMRGHLLEAGLGTVSEILDGDAPYAPRGCIAQAWSVAAILEAWEMVGGSP